MGNVPTKNLERWIKRHNPTREQLKYKIKISFRALNEDERDDLFVKMWKYSEFECKKANTHAESFSSWKSYN